MISTKTIIKNNFAKVYNNLLIQLMLHEDEVFKCSPRGMEIREILNASFIIEDPTLNGFENEIRSISKKYLCAELYWYFSGRNDLEFIQNYSKFWNNIANEDGTVNSAYGYLLFKKKTLNMTSWKWAYNSLVKDINSRQSIIRFNLPEHQYEGNKDFVCTMYGQFFIRENELHLKMHMRSSDIIFGLTYDIPFFTLLQQQMLIHLKPFYPNLKLGKFIFNTGSLHIYKRHYDLAKSMLENKFLVDSTPEVVNSLINPDGETTHVFKQYEVVYANSNTLNCLPHDSLMKMIFEHLKEDTI